MIDWKEPYSYKSKGILGRRFSILFGDKIVGECQFKEEIVKEIIKMLNTAFYFGTIKEQKAPNSRLNKAVEVLQRIKDRYPYIWGECIADGEIDIINGKEDGK